ncbi:MAG TPA: hypothetical protein VG733_04415 [Chthoniobacteraceae bacterium]|nr:hypothetical protein [Chthoniobacteraceae bacterium]
MKDEGGRMKGGICVAALFLFFILHPSAFLLAQENTPPPEKRGVQLQFITPPMEGTISMGIYDSTGKLVRVLHQDAPTTDFFPALNGLITFWDGKDDAGKPMPAGKYRAKGFMMAEMDFEGVAFLGNDFVNADDKSPRVRRVSKIGINKQGLLNGEYEIIGGPGDSAGFDSGESRIIHSDGPDTARTPQISVTATIADGKLVIHSHGADATAPLADGESVVDACPGFGDIVWAIVKTKTGEEVRAYAGNGEFIRRLAIAPGDPQPVSIKASLLDPEIYLLEENAKMQRLRTLKLEQAAAPSPKPDPESAPAVSTWKVTSSKTIVFSDTLDQAKDLLKMSDGKPFVAQDKITLKLAPNPLEQNKAATLDVAIGVDAKGSFIKTLDGLPLCRVSETPNLKWAAMALEADGKTVTIFQSDGAVIEQFKVTKLSNMAGFDAGDFDFDPATVK